MVSQLSKIKNPKRTLVIVLLLFGFMITSSNLIATLIFLTICFTFFTIIFENASEIHDEQIRQKLIAENKERERINQAKKLNITVIDQKLNEIEKNILSKTNPLQANKGILRQHPTHTSQASTQKKVSLKTTETKLPSRTSLQ